MSSISSLAQSQSPLSRLKTELSSEVSSGAIPSSDTDALSSALDVIDSSLKDSRTSKSGTSSSKPDPAEMQSKIASLIDDQVSSGKLTSDQGTELKQLFQNAAPAKGQGGPGGAGGAGGPPPGPPPSSTEDDSDDATSSASSTASDMINDFLKQLQSTTSASYSASGSAASSTDTSRLFNFTT